MIMTAVRPMHHSHHLFPHLGKVFHAFRTAASVAVLLIKSQPWYRAPTAFALTKGGYSMEEKPEYVWPTMESLELKGADIPPSYGQIWRIGEYMMKL